MCEERLSFSEELCKMLTKVSGEKIDIAAKIYLMLAKEEEVGKKLRYFLENADEIESSKEEEVEQYFMPRRVGELREKCEDLVKSVLGKLIKENMDEDKFYDALWEKGIWNNPFLEQEDEKIYALYCIWRDSRIPYFKLETGIKMTNEQFREISIMNKAQIKKALFIINSDFSQKTERCSLLNNILEASESENEKAVVLAHILDATVQKNIFRLLDHEFDEGEDD